MMKWLWKFASPKVSLWKEETLKQAFPELHSLSQAHEASVADLWTGQGWNLHLRRNLNDWEITSIARFHDTMARATNLIDEQDRLIWKGERKEEFTVRSAYRELRPIEEQQAGWPWRMIWRTKIPYKTRGLILLGVNSLLWETIPATIFTLMTAPTRPLGHNFWSLLNQLREPLIERNYKKQNEVADQLAKQYGYRMHDNIIHFTVSPLFDLAFKADKLGITSYRSTTVCSEAKSLSL
ncbi:hypothetical protein MTR67_020562 [Solanum verrucosum]|uniref:Uncharacterized protein n=1 Tax=Solanum verrucosum TaxID=315347 RepID=A0AAF0QNI9_SOLVR|nr:hypothetical protein MTR67_020562 [Solanum verrucosum]